MDVNQTPAPRAWGVISGGRYVFFYPGFRAVSTQTRWVQVSRTRLVEHSGGHFHFHSESRDPNFFPENHQNSRLETDPVVENRTIVEYHGQGMNP